MPPKQRRSNNSIAPHCLTHLGSTMSNPSSADPSIDDPLARNLLDCLDAVRECLDRRQLLPALMLIYALIDAIAWSASAKQRNTTEATFVDWVERWLLPDLLAAGIDVTGRDLFAARCGVLHRMAPDSDLAARGAARKIAYAWGHGRVEILRDALQEVGASNVVALHVEDLFSALIAGVQRFSEHADTDPDLSRRLHVATSAQFAIIPTADPSGNPPNQA